MIDKINTLRMERQRLIHRACETEYDSLYRDLQPGQNVYWNGFGDPPSLIYRTDFNDMEYNRIRQRDRILVKGRFAGGNLGWIIRDDMELYACLYRKPLDNPTARQSEVLDLIKREGPLNIQQMKEISGMLVKEITPVLHRLQEAFLVCEDQNEGQEDRGWYTFREMFPDVDLNKYSRHDALKILLKRFAFRIVCFDVDMAKSFFKLSAKEIKAGIAALHSKDILIESKNGYLLKSDYELLKTYTVEPKKSVFAMHRNDFLVKSNEHVLKEKYKHSYPDTLYYLLIDGHFCGAAVGKFRYTPEVEDIILDLPSFEAEKRKAEILCAVHLLCGKNNQIKRFRTEEIS